MKSSVNVISYSNSLNYKKNSFQLTFYLIIVGNHRFELDQMKDKHLFEVSDQVDQGILIAARSGDKYCISFEKKSGNFQFNLLCDANNKIFILKDFLDTIDWLKNCIARAGSTRG